MQLASRFFYFLVPSGLQTLISLLLLPLTTYILDPEDFGSYALVVAVTTLGLSLATSSAGYLLAEHFPTGSRSSRSGLVSSLTISGLVISLLFTGIVFALWPAVRAASEALSPVASGALALGLGSLVMATPWTVANQVVVLEGAAKVFALVTVASSLVSAITVTLCLYLFRLGQLSLFVANFAASLALLVGSVVVLRPYLRVPDRLWLGRILRLSYLSAPASGFETFQAFLERSLLTIFVGLNQLGIYSHSQQYRNFTFTPIKAASNTVWPVTLDEARNERNTFAKTGAVWGSTYVLITLLGVGFATVGPELIGLITHGKFVAAAPFVSAWMVFLLIQTSGKPQFASLYAAGKSTFLAKLTSLSAGLGTLCLLAFVPWLGLWGAVTAAATQQLVFRIGVQLRARRLEPTPFQDAWVFAGCLLTGAAALLSARMEHLFGMRLVLFAVLAAGLVMAGIHPVRRGLATLQGVRVYNLMPEDASSDVDSQSSSGGRARAAQRR